MTPPRYLTALRAAIEAGYHVDPATGTIISPRGRQLRLYVRRDKPYPEVTLTVPGYHRPRVAIAAHKVVAFAIWGDAAFAPGVHVRHLNGIHDLRAESLALGSPSQNERDKDPAVRWAIATNAASKAKLTKREKARIRRLITIGHNNTEIGRRLGVHRSTVARIRRTR